MCNCVYSFMLHRENRTLPIKKKKKKREKGTQRWQAREARLKKKRATTWVCELKKMLGFLLLVTLKRRCFKPHINFNISSKTTLFQF